MAQFQVQPVNTYARVGEAITMLCTIDNAGQIGNPQSWTEYIYSGSRSLVSQNDKILEAYVNDYVILGQYNLNIPSVALKHAGKYGCSDKDANEFFNQLIVLGTGIGVTSPNNNGLYNVCLSYRQRYISIS